MSATTPLTRTVKEGKQWTKNWQNKYPTLSKAFLIPVDDLLACFNEMGVKIDSDGKLKLNAGDFGPAVRAYRAIEDSGDEALLIVGTKTTDGIQYDDIVTTDGDGSSGIYDFTKPCPSNCDKSSLLYHKVKIAFSK